MFIEFEGLPSQSHGERRLKRSPLCDVTGMLRSFDYAAQSTLLGLGTGRGRPQGVIRETDRAALSPWSEFWRLSVTRSFLNSYLAVRGIAELLPSQPADLQRLLNIFMLERFMVELTYELWHRQRWLSIPLSGLLRLLHA